MPSKKASGKLSVSVDASASGRGGTRSTTTNGASHAPSTDAPNGRKPSKIATVSHTLDAEMAERLRHFAFRERISESAVIEYALGAFFLRGDDAELGQLLRDAGAALRRKI